MAKGHAEQEGLTSDQEFDGVFSEYFDVLDRVQNANKVKEKDAKKVEAASEAIEAWEKKKGKLSEGARRRLQSLRTLLDAALSKLNSEGVQVVGEKASNGKGGKAVPRKEIGEEFGSRTDRHDAERDRRARNGAQYRSKDAGQGRRDGEDAPEYQEWNSAFEVIEANLEVLVALENQDECQSAFQYLQTQIPKIREGYEKNVAALKEQGGEVDDLPWLKLVADRLYYNETALLQARQAYERAQVGWVFFDAIAGWNERFKDIEGLTCADRESCVLASQKVEEIYGEFREYLRDWDAKVKPILQTYPGKLPGAWQELVVAQKVLRQRASELESGLRERLHAFHKETQKNEWESGFPQFEYDFAMMLAQFSDARLLEREARKKAFEALIAEYQLLLERWNALRKFGPRPSEEARKRGEKTPVGEYDGRVTALGKTLEEYRDRSLTARSARFEVLARDWRNDFARMRSVWIDDMDIGARGALLEDFGFGNVSEDAVRAVVKPEFQEGFLHVIATPKIFGIMKERGDRLRSRKEQSGDATTGDKKMHYELRRFLQLQDAARREMERVLHGPDWRIEDIEERRSRLVVFLSEYRERGDAAFLGKRMSPGLRKAVQGWVDAERDAALAGRRVQRCIDEDPESAKLLDQKAFRDFVLPVPNEHDVALQRTGESVVSTSTGLSDGASEPEEDAPEPVQQNSNIQQGSGDDSADDEGNASTVVQAAESSIVSSQSEVEMLSSANAEVKASDDDRREMVRAHEKELRALLRDNVFWQEDFGAVRRGTLVQQLLRSTAADPRILNDEGLRADRANDFYALIPAFTSVEDLAARIAALKERYAAEEAEEARRKVDSHQESAPAAGADGAEVKRAESQGEESVDSADPQVGNREEDVFANDEPLPRVVPVRRVFPPFTDGGRRAPETPRREAAGPEAGPEALRPVKAKASEPGQSPVVPKPRIAPVPEPVVALEIPVSRPASESPHAEVRVSNVARRIRETVGRWFGRGVGDYAATEITGERSQESAKPMDARETVVRTVAPVMSAVAKVFGFKVLVDVPRYFSQSFFAANERVYLQEEIMGAMEDESKARGKAPEDSLRANVEASQRLERAIATSAYLAPEVRERLLARVTELRSAYEERTRQNMQARSREVAKILEDAVTTRVTGWQASKEVANSALRLLALSGAGAGFEAARGVTYGVMSFREKFEAVAKRDKKAGVLANIATVFSKTVMSTWQKLTTSTESVSTRMVNIAEAFATLGTVVGMTGVAVSDLEDALPGLRAAGAVGGSGVASLAIEARQAIQDRIDQLLPAFVRQASRTA